MGCLVIFGFVLVGGGVVMGWDGLPAILSGVMVLWCCWDMRPGQSYKIDTSVNNRIVAHDGHGRYLVEAKTSRQITGPRPHVTGNLPANIIQAGKGLWVVDRGGFQPDGYDKTKWIPLEGYSIQPRGNTQTNGFLADEMEGWEHNYLQRDE